MEDRTDISREILFEFLERWNIDKVNSMTLEQYVSVGNKDTFCQWLETKTRALGSINGVSSMKFGIYKRGDIKKRPKNLVRDNQYSWQKFYGTNRNDAFQNIQKEIINIIKFAERGQFEKIEDIHLTSFVKWKIAYLYSNERLIPIFKKSVLQQIAKYYGLDANYKTKNSEIQNLIIKNKPSHLSIYEFAQELYDRFGRETGNQNQSGKRRKPVRKSSKTKNTESQKRKGSRSYIATQKHNLLQEALRIKLENKYGENNVFLEEDHVDIKVKFPNKLYFYEVKSSSYASECVREALGQIISYSQKDNDKRKKCLFVAGQYPPNDDELGFIDYIKDVLRIEFEYINIDLKE